MRRIALTIGLVAIACSATPTAPPLPHRAAPAAELSARPSIAAADLPAIDPLPTRDPFRCELRDAVKPPPPPPLPPDVHVKARDFALDELQLIAVVTRTTPRAMFRTPTGEGILVKRGERISKSASRVRWILSDSVVVRVTKTGADDPGESDLVIAMHPAS
jgi:Tfp pilus assembly protein PilP